MMTDSFVPPTDTAQLTNIHTYAVTKALSILNSGLEGTLARRSKESPAALRSKHHHRGQGEAIVDPVPGELHPPVGNSAMGGRYCRFSSWDAAVGDSDLDGQRDQWCF